MRKITRAFRSMSRAAARVQVSQQSVRELLISVRASRAIKDTEITIYPTLQAFEIGACAACFIVNSSNSCRRLINSRLLYPSYITDSERVHLLRP